MPKVEPSTDDAAELVTKSQLAQILEVSPGRVSQYIKEGKLNGCLVGEGRSAKIDVAKAMVALNQKIDPGQRLGNGLNTKIEVPASGTTVVPDSAQEPANAAPTGPTIEDRLKHEKLMTAQRANRRQAEDDALRRGQLVPAADARRELQANSTRMMQTFEGMISDMATELSAKFSLPQRDILHAMKQSFTAQRRRAAARAQEQADHTPAEVEVILEQEMTLQ